MGPVFLSWPRAKRDLVLSHTATLLLLRHGATEWNVARRQQGHADIEMNEEGRKQAALIAEELARLPIGAIYSSDLGRALETARLVAQPHDLNVQIEPAFREINEGEWEGLTEVEIRQRWPNEWQHRLLSRRPSGESPDEVRARSFEGIRRVVLDNPGKMVVIVTHQGTIRYILAEALGLAPERLLDLPALRPGEAVRMDAHLEDNRMELSNIEWPREEL